jgi:hypothetical protein
MEQKMQEDWKLNFQYCAKCEVYYMDIIGETCRCPIPNSEPKAKDELSGKWQDGVMTL